MLKKAFQGKSNSKNVFLDYERLNVKEMYAFTFNPVQQPAFGQPLAVKDWYDTLTDFFKSLKYCSVKMYTEVSKTGRWHFHGFMYVKDKLRFTIYDVPKIIERGSSEVDTMGTVDDYMRWLIYCNKQQSEMQEFLTDHLYCVIDPKVLAKRNSDGVILITT